MMQDDQPQADKPYDATPRKLDEARKKGQIVRSADLNTAISYAGFLGAALMLGPWAAERLGTLSHRMWSDAHLLAPLILGAGGWDLSAGVMMPPLLILGAAVAVPGGLLLAALFAQRGLLFTPSKLAPKLNRIAPVENAKQKYGAQGLFQFAKSAAKLAITSVILALYLVARADDILMSLYADPGQVLVALGRLTFDFLVVVTMVALAIAAVDWAWEWSQHQIRNRMSRQELQDETKSAEGDPQMKQLRRQKAQALAMNQMMADVPTADVVIVNPTHFAVALSWDRVGRGVPICVAKGQDEVAFRIREIAAEAGVPVYRDAPTARSLYSTVDIGAPIPPDQFKAVAAAIRFADLLRAKVRAGTARS